MPKIPDSWQPFLPFDAPQQLLTPDEIYADADELLLASLDEDRRIERKPATYKPRALGEYFSMWANTSPDGGLIALGIADDGELLGCRTLSQKQINALDLVKDHYCPDARYVLKNVPVRNSAGEKDFLMLFRIFYRPDKVVKTTAGEAFIRRGDEKKKLTTEEVRELEIDKGQLDIEQEPVPLSYPADFDEELIQAFCDAFRESRSLLNGRSAAEIMEMRHLGRRSSNGFIPNTACALLFAKDPRSVFPGCRIRFMRFDGEYETSGDRFNLIKDIWVEGPVPRQIVEAERVVEGQLRDFSRLGPDNKFYTAPEYPRQAWYEAIVNACVHRSYGLRAMHITVKMFDDRLEIESPGGFPPTVNAQNIYSAQHSRNPHLVDAMYYLRFVKIANEGVRRMRDTMVEMGLPKPEFREREKNQTTVRVTLRNDIKQRRVWLDSDAATVVGEAVSRSLTQEERRLINWIAEHGAINVSQAQRLSSRSWHTAKKILEGLVQRGILSRVGREDVDRDPKARFVLAVERD